MDFGAPLEALMSYFSGSSPVTQQATPQTSAPIGKTWMPHPMRFDANKRPIADEPLPNEKTVDVYPTANYLVPTKENQGKPQAALKLPVDYVNSLAKAHAKSKSLGMLDDETHAQMLPLAIREARFDDYGNNGVYVDYKTPPPKHLNRIIERSNDLALKLKEMEMKAKQAKKLGKTDLVNTYENLANKLQASVEAEDAKLLADPNWTSRASSYKDITDKALKLGLKQSTNQEIIRDKVTGKLISKADVYRPGPKDGYYERALHVPLALYVKSKEQPGLKGLKLSKYYIGDGPDADARIAQQAEIYKYLPHAKNKDFYNAYNNLTNQHYTTFIKGTK